MSNTERDAMTMNAATLGTMSPADARLRLELGNQRFRSGESLNRDLPRQVRETSGGQAPFAAVLGCIDSRAAAELVFDQGVGDVFHARIAGNCVNDDILGSLEFACKVVGSKLIVVLGHSRCGAVMGACGGVELGHLTGLLAKLQPAVDATPHPSDPGQRNAQNAEFVQNVAVRNVDLTVAAIREHSEILRELEQQGSIQIVGAMYEVGTGAVEFR